MPVFLITLRTYRSWTEDNPKGYNRRGTPGRQKPDEALAIRRAALAKQPPVRLTGEQQAAVLELARDIVTRRAMRLHAASCTATHVHLVASWFGTETFFNGETAVMKQAHLLASKCKNILATGLSKQAGTTGNKWFSRGEDCQPVTDREHLNHLLSEYLPKHTKEGGQIAIYDKGDTQA